MNKTALFIILLALVTFYAPALTHAQDQDFGDGIAVHVPIVGGNIKEGSVISYTANGYILSKVAYDPTAYGVVAKTPALEVVDLDREKSQYPVFTSGKTYVRVSTASGPIKAGNLLTTSETSGLAQKATMDGYIIGTAMEDYTESDPKKEGLILTSISLGFNTESTVLRENLLSNLKTSVSSPFLTPVNSLRYMVAGSSVVLSLLAALLLFGKVTASGVDAIGRNPLASKAILLSIAINLLLTLAIMGIGIAIAYLVLIL